MAFGFGYGYDVLGRRRRREEEEGMKGMKWLWIAYYGRVLVGFAVDKEEKRIYITYRDFIYIRIEGARLRRVFI